MLRRPLAFAALFALGFLPWLAQIGRAGEAPSSRYERVEVAPARTSIYIGSVSLTMPPFARAGATYRTTYAAKVFPYFFSNETGRLSVEFTDEMLRTLERGEAIEFEGRALNATGAERRVHGKATPADAATGKLKVRVVVSPRIELIFNTTYRFTGPAITPEAAAPGSSSP